MLGMKRAYGRTDADRICRLCSSNSGIIVLNIFDGEGKKRRILSLINSCLPVKRSEERTGVQRREIYEHSPADQLEVIMVKEEPQEEIAAGDEDSRWQDTSIEEENVMQAEETELDLISPGDRIKSEDCGSIEPPVLRMKEMSSPAEKRSDTSDHLGRSSTEFPLTTTTSLHYPSSYTPSHTQVRVCKTCVMCLANKTKQETTHYCEQCEVPLCLFPCFQIYHTMKDFNSLSSSSLSLMPPLSGHFSDQIKPKKKLKPYVDPEKRFDQAEHMPVKGKSRRCAHCSTAAMPHRTRWSCQSCRVGLCMLAAKNCFKEYHTKK
ncbi:uncharacterized protein [Periplaneta americana]|uniref:uncharacterized protein isoform X8 n=1 Tax=Periplaneta americana TaxID=6978 RepID=UPI0037E830AE